ncbi:ABC transporter substrate-binding protein [Vagococcus sp. JNUCC 83]
MKKFRIAATGVSMNYMPQYLAYELGFFKEEGLDVISYTPTPWVKGLDDINQTDADALLGGIWVPIMYHEHIKNYESVAKIASKCPLFIVSREPVTPFSWKEMENKRVLVSGGDGASHYVAALGSAQKGGANVSNIRFIHDFSTSMLCELFEGGFGDFIVLQPDVAHAMIAKNKGHFFCNLTENDTKIPWSVYYTLPETIKSDTDKFTRFVSGLQKGTDYLLDHGGNACQDIIQKYWPHLSVEEGIRTIDQFIAQGMWTRSVRINEDELMDWQKDLQLGDLIDQPIPYHTLVNNGPYDAMLNKREDGQ